MTFFRKLYEQFLDLLFPDKRPLARPPEHHDKPALLDPAGYFWHQRRKDAYEEQQKRFGNKGAMRS